MIKIITDSGSDISQEEGKILDITIIPFKTYFNEEEYLDGITLSHRQFYEKLIEEDTLPKTSQITPFEFEEIFKEATKDGDEVIYISISKKLSGTYQSACIASLEFDGLVRVVDSENACAGEQILVKLACDLRKQGYTIDEMEEKLNEMKKQIKLLALVDTLEYLKKGGRISSTTAFIGNLLSIKPVIEIKDGEVGVAGKARGSKNGNNILRELVTKSGGIDFDLPFCIVYSGLSDELLKKYIEDSKDLYEGIKNLQISTIGCTIGTHVGPGAIGVGFFAKEK